MATEKAETDRIPVTLALSTITYLEKLVRQGTPRHQRSRRRAYPDRGRHPSRHQGRAFVDSRQR
ncbi:hypothetical protein QUS64_22540, partial [Xanthomonas citri pv. citri]